MTNAEPTRAEMCEQLVNEQDPLKILALVDEINRVEYSRACERCEEKLAVAFSAHSGAAVCAECQVSEATTYERKPRPPLQDAN
jgi:hypothetical protein